MHLSKCIKAAGSAAAQQPRVSACGASYLISASITGTTCRQAEAFRKFSTTSVKCYLFCCSRSKVIKSFMRLIGLYSFIQLQFRSVRFATRNESNDGVKYHLEEDAGRHLTLFDICNSASEVSYYRQMHCGSAPGEVVSVQKMLDVSLLSLVYVCRVHDFIFLSIIFHLIYAKG